MQIPQIRINCKFTGLISSWWSINYLQKNLNKGLFEDRLIELVNFEDKDSFESELLPIHNELVESCQKYIIFEDQVGHYFRMMIIDSALKYEL